MPANSRTSTKVSVTAKAVASFGTLVFTLYVKTWSRLVRVSSALPFTSFLISGSSGLGGVTGTSLESLVKPGLFGRSAL